MLKHTLLLVTILVFSFIVGCISNNSTDENGKYPVCENEDDINKYDGEYVKLIGIYDYATMGKEMDHVILEDFKSVYIYNKSELKEPSIHDEHTVKIIGKIEKTNYTEIDQSTSIARVLDIKSIETIDK